MCGLVYFMQIVMFVILKIFVFTVDQRYCVYPLVLLVTD